ncbi:hypothetical protein CO038_04860 [Candidatus Pacearchaeota archaeon CG_4_9_14_0_2_um_filter_39_13]|nr:MAG: hypothetical protein CO038_04860 [Candidatus Pacearchaeota archaeon CG_4_9_14_0_2_um_filter_39_13]
MPQKVKLHLNNFSKCYIMLLIKKIKEKKELSGIPDNIVKEVLDKVLKSYPSGLSKKDEKLVIKESRSLLRNYVGRFKAKSSASIIKMVEKGRINEALMLHASTRERMPFYDKLRKMIKDMRPGRILDIGCGLNPLAVAEKTFFYYASDIDENNLAVVKKFFDMHSIQGEIFIADMRKERNFPEADLCLILKVFDIVKMPHKEVESLLACLKCRAFIMSFPTITLSGKQMKNKRRIWFEIILNKLGMKFEIISSSNELFYISHSGRPKEDSGPGRN